jgi:ATP-dependent DNA ligase
LGPLCLRDSQNRPRTQKQFVIDGEAVILGVDGRSDFDALHSERHNDEVQLLAFDVLAMDGDDLRNLPLSKRKANLALRLLARRPDGIFLSEFEQGEIGPDLFRKACEFGLEGLVSKRRDRTISRRTIKALDQGQEQNTRSVRSRARSSPTRRSHFSVATKPSCNAEPL